MTLDLDSLRAFVNVADLGSFTQAGDRLGSSKSRVSSRIRDLERELGTTLLQRSTRLVTLTPDGHTFLERARTLLLEADELGAMFQGPRALRGQVRVDLPIQLARDTVFPRLPELFARHPGLELVVSTTDRLVDPWREGFDAVVRVGEPGDASLVGRRLGLLTMANCASPTYLAKYGTPRTLDELATHVVVHYTPRPDASPSFEYVVEGRAIELPMRSFVTVNNVDAYRAACLAGLGIIQVPRMSVVHAFADGSLVEVLPELLPSPMPVTLLHTHGRSVPRRVRAVLAWLEELLAPRFAVLSTPRPQLEAPRADSRRSARSRTRATKSAPPSSPTAPRSGTRLAD